MKIIIITLLSVLLISCGDDIKTPPDFSSTSGGVYFGETGDSLEKDGVLYLEICCNKDTDEGMWVEAESHVVEAAGLESKIGALEEVTTEVSFYLEPKFFSSSPDEYIPLEMLKFKVVKIEVK